MTDRVRVSPRVLQWSRQRSRLTIDDLQRRFPKLEEWERGESDPTFRQVENFARVTRTPIGFLFLEEPPIEDLPIADFRTFGDEAISSPSPDLLDTIYTCELRQEWFRDFALAQGSPAIELVGMLSTADDVLDAGKRIGVLLGFGLSQRSEFSTWTAALSGLAELAENLGILVMISGIVGSNSHRGLNPQEFRGFSLVDPIASVIFINGADTKAAQIFSLAHELAHVALGESAVSCPDLGDTDERNSVERWCNQVAAELLVPASSFREEYDDTTDLTEELERLARFYKVSTLVILRRVFDIGRMAPAEYRAAYRRELERVMERSAERGSGGNFYNTQPIRDSKRFSKALISDTIEGGTSYRDAFRLLGFKKLSAFEELGRRLGAT